MRYVPCSSSLIEFPSTELARYSIIKWLTCFHWWIEIWATTAFTWFTYRSNSLPKLHTLKLPFGNLLLSTWLFTSFHWLLFFNTATRWFRFVIGYSTSKSFFHSFSICVSRFPLLFHVERFSLLLEYFYTYLRMLLICLFIKLPFASWTLHQISSSTTHRLTWVFFRILWRLLGLIVSCQFIMEIEFWRPSTNRTIHHGRLLRTEWVISGRWIDIISRLLIPFLSLRSALVHVLSWRQSLPTLSDAAIWSRLIFIWREGCMIRNIVFWLLLRCLGVIFIGTISII